MIKSKEGIYTTAIHAGCKRDAQFGALTTPIYQTSTFEFESAEQGGARFALEEPGYIYTRLGNPTVTVLEEKMAALEGAEAALAVSSGMGAVSSIFWTLLKAGDHVVADKMLYGCSFAFINHGLTRFGIEVDFVDMSDMEQLKKALRPNTRIVYFETPANPTLKVVDIKLIADTAHGYNKDIAVVIDNTFATPVLTRPIELGCDVVLHSATKYLNGHGDVIAGLIAGTKAFIDNCRFVGLKDMTGAVLGPFDAYLIIRGLKTLPLRVKRHCESAMEVAKALAEHPMVERVFYPGLEEDAGHEIAKKQMQGGFGSIIAFEVKGGKASGIKVCNNVKMAKLAVSLGDCETLIQHPASMTHSTYNAEELAAAGLSEGLLRLSVGLEDVEDIIEDLNQALHI